MSVEGASTGAEPSKCLLKGTTQSIALTTTNVFAISNLIYQIQHLLDYYSSWVCWVQTAESRVQFSFLFSTWVQVQHCFTMQPFLMGAKISSWGALHEFVNLFYIVCVSSEIALFLLVIFFISLYFVQATCSRIYV